MLKPPYKPIEEGELDSHFKKAAEVCIQYDRASASLLQRRLDIGYARAARIIDQLENTGILGPADGSKPREVLIHSLDELPAIVKRVEEERLLEQEDYIEQPPKSYPVPLNVKLTKVDDSIWEPQLASIVNTSEFKNNNTPFPVLLGYAEDKLKIKSLKDVGNLIVVGNPQSNKETFIDTFLVNLLIRHNPVEMRLILIDPNHYLDLYNGLPHLLDPVITEFSRSIAALRWTMSEVDRRLKMFSQAGVRNISQYNEIAEKQDLPRIIVVHNPSWFDVETTDELTRLTDNIGLRAGIHVVIISRSMDGMNFPKELKANVPARLVFKVTSSSESRGAEVKGADVLKPGEAIYKSNSGQQMQLKTVLTPDVNVKEVVDVVVRGLTL